MQLSGTLRSWNDERGFGFIAPTHGGAELFVHISEFPRDGSRPTVGEKLGYELGRGRDGKPQAVKVIRLAIGANRPTKNSGSGLRPRRTKSSLVGTFALVALLMIAGAWGYQRLTGYQHRQALAAQPAEVQGPAVSAPSTDAPAAAAESFRCDGRTTCSQMTSCAEATWFINHCPGTQMDGNRDGVPCEQQWCTHPSAP